MADGIDLVLQGMRDFGGGVAAGGAGFARAAEMDDRRAEMAKKAEAERIRKERLGQLSAQIEEINTAAQAEDFDQRKFADKAKPIMQGAIELGDPSILRSLDPIQEIINQREGERKANIAAGRQEAIARRQEKQDALAASKEDFDRVNTIKQTLKPSREKLDKSRQALKVVEDAASKKTPAGDVALITSFAKAVDEGARVTDQDFKNAQAARKLMTRLEEDGSPAFVPLQAILQRWDPDNGTTLTDEQRQDFAGTVRDSYKSRLEQSVKDEEEATSMATDFGIKPERIIKNSAKKEWEEFNAAEEKKRQEKEQKKKNAALTIGEGVKDKSNLNVNNEGWTIWDEKMTDAFLKNPNNQAKYMPALQAMEGRLGRPLTQEEKLGVLKAYLEKKKIRVLGGANGGAQ